MEAGPAICIFERGPRRVVSRTRLHRAACSADCSRSAATATWLWHAFLAEQRGWRGGGGGGIEEKTSRWNPTPSSWRHRYHLKEFLFLLAPLFYSLLPLWCLMFRIKARTYFFFSFSRHTRTCVRIRTWWKDRRFFRRVNGTSESRAKEEVLGCDW